MVLLVVTGTWRFHKRKFGENPDCKLNLDSSLEHHTSISLLVVSTMHALFTPGQSQATVSCAVTANKLWSSYSALNLKDPVVTSTPIGHHLGIVAKA
ncbi:hypothetical protein AVEN_247071-1 [Araneus ventricosus]|uniref:Uncharacterized protein n=1 Tax=Araneus ventricosus TaxID=182803 RepID=A0A4Y2SKP2_ARAVE|nr:hypothetical protein AVEN_247071-1 [Araneus ventricosus]